MGTPSVIRQILERVATTMPQIIPRTEAESFPFKLWNGDVPLEQATMPNLYRAFRVKCESHRTPRCNSNRSITYFRAVLEITIGYPLYLINPQEASFAGIEAIVAEDIADIISALVRERKAALHTIGPVRSLIPESPSRTNKTVTLPFDLEWGQPR